MTEEQRKICLLGAFLLIWPAALAAQTPDTLWLKTYGGFGDDWGSQVEQTSDGGYIIVGRTLSFGNGWQFYLIKTDSTGVETWGQTYGGSEWDFAESVQQASDGGYIIAGYAGPIGSYDIVLLKADSLGNELWRKTYGGSQIDEAKAVEQTDDGGFMIAGITASEGAGGYDFYLIKTDSLAGIEWSRTYGGPGSDVCFSAQQTSDGGYILAGYTNSHGPGIPNWLNLYLVKADSVGDTTWTRVHGVANQDEAAYSVHQTSDGGYILGGYLHPMGSLDVYGLKTDSLGFLEWDNTYGGSHGACIKQTSNGEYIFAGYWAFDSTSYDLYILKLDTLGDVAWSRLYGGPGKEIDMALSVAAISDSEFVVTGRTESWNAKGGDDAFLMKIAPVYVGIQDKELLRHRFLISPITPNPFSKQAVVKYELPESRHVQVEVYDILGQKIATLANKKMNAGKYKIVWNGQDSLGERVHSGIYFLRFVAGEYQGAEKVVLVR